MDAEFAIALQTIKEYRVGELSCSAPRITTATVVCNLSGVERINLEDVRDNPLLVVRTAKSKKKTYRAFSNSVTIIFDRTKAVKVFVNGKLHITGCNEIAQAIRHANAFAEAMGWAAARAEGVKVLTLNVALGVQPRRNVLLKDFYAFLSSQSGLHARYNPDIYQGLVLKVPCESEPGRMVSVLLFYTGTMMITGARVPGDLVHTHDVVMRAFKEAAPFDA
jgi:TATA-box binding protein (TBP) (component of TFIID and TFIIIB)